MHYHILNLKRIEALRVIVRMVQAMLNHIKEK